MNFPATPHPWSVSPHRAIAIQRELASRVRRSGKVRNPQLLAGADVAFSPGGDRSIAGVVVWDAHTGEVREQHVATTPTRFPYVPGLLSFREAPAILQALRKVKCEPDVIMLDGQGFAHPRRFGLACHIGVLIDRPTLGCAKSLLVGTFATLGLAKRSASPLFDGDQRVGMALRTRENVKPVYVSVGHRLSLETAVAITLAGCTRYRLPEPTRLADRLVARERLR